MDKNANPNGGTSKMTPSEILAAQKAWRMQKRRELEARNKKKQARQQIVDTNYNAAVVAQHASAAAPPQNVGQTVVPPIKRFKANYHADNPQLAAPVENNSGVVYSVASFPASQPATYQHYEYVGAPQTLLSSPTTTTTTPITTDEQSRTAEAQRAWKEQKLREIAEKKAKGTPSKRGRRKMAGIPTPGVEEEALLATRSDTAIVTSIAAATMAMTTNSMPIPATHSVPLASHSMPLASHALVQAQQNQEADAATGQTAAELVAMANQPMAPNPLEQYTFMGTTEHKDDQHQVEQPQNVDAHQQVVPNVGHHDQQQIVENVTEHHQQQLENVPEHHQQVVQTVAEVHQPQMQNVAEHHPQQMETVAEHHPQEQMPAVETHQQQIEQGLEVQHSQQVDNVEQHAQHGPAVTVSVHGESVGNVEQHAQASGNVEVADQQGATVETHQVETENVAVHEHQGETVMVSHHQAQEVEDVKNVQETKTEVLDANGVATDGGGGGGGGEAYADTTTAGDSFQIDGSEDIIGAASAWHDGLGNINHN